MKVKHAIAKSIKVLGLCLMTGALTLVVLWGCTTERGGRGPVVEDARSRSSAGASVKKSAPARTQSAAKLVQAPVEEGYYRVVRGDTLFSIAFRYGQDYRTLAAQNGIEAPYNITEGQLLKVGKSAPSYSAVRTKPQTAAPAAASSSAAAAADKRIIHVVKKGETLSSVGRQHNIAPSSIVRINKLKAPYTLIPGQILNVNPAADQAAYPQQTAAAPAAASVKERAAPAAPDSAARAERTEQDLLKAKSSSSATTAPVAAAAPAVAAASAQASGGKAQSKNESKTQPKAAASAPKSADAAAAPVEESAAPVVVPGKTRKVGGVQWMWPARGKVIKGFSSGEHGNKGLDISGSRGQNILSAADGQVVYAGNALRGYGNLIIINHDNEYLSAYAHNERLLVKEGSTVKRGQVVATMGSTDADSVRLHFEIRYRGKSINPTGCLPKQ